MSPYLRYIPGTKDGQKFPETRFPSKGEWDREKCERVWREMGGYGRIEIVDENEADERENALEIRENEGTNTDDPRGCANTNSGALPTNGASTDA